MRNLAFDDGPLDTTPAILEILRAHGRTATFFLVGERIAGNEAIVAAIIANGHRLGNHSWSHRPLIELPQREIAHEIARTDAELLGLTGIWPKPFRPPFVRWDDGNVVRIANAFGHECHLEPSFGDYNLTADEILAAAQALAASKTLWLHDGVSATVDALPKLLALP